MKKEAYRDYATAAFRFYARCEKCGIWPERGTADWEDCNAVKDCLDKWARLSPTKLGEMELAVRTIYMTEPESDIRRGEIIRRVRRFAMEQFIDDSTVYRILKDARLEFAVARGLRL